MYFFCLECESSEHFFSCLSVCMGECVCVCMGVCARSHIIIRLITSVM